MKITKVNHKAPKWAHPSAATVTPLEPSVAVTPTLTTAVTPAGETVTIYQPTSIDFISVTEAQTGNQVAIEPINYAFGADDVGNTYSVKYASAPYTDWQEAYQVTIEGPEQLNLNIPQGQQIAEGLRVVKV